jgi:hypothetical protein
MPACAHKGRPLAISKPSTETVACAGRRKMINSSAAVQPNVKAYLKGVRPLFAIFYIEIADRNPQH